MGQKATLTWARSGCLEASPVGHPAMVMLQADGNWTGGNGMGISVAYPLVNIEKTMENHHVSWVNPL